MIGDGEQTKTGFFAYIGERLSGFEPRADRSPLDAFRPEVDSFPEYYEQYFQTAMTGGMAAPVVPLGCTGPVSYTGHERLRRDLDLLRAAAGEAGPDEVFVCAVAPSGVGGTGSAQDKLAIAGLYANAINRSLRGIPRERVRVHTCYGINEGPRGTRRVAGGPGRCPVHDRGRGLLLRGRQPAARARLPRVRDGQAAPRYGAATGVISHATNIVEHPEVIADRIVRFAELVGRENVVASADCGFSSQASYPPEIHPKIVWAKFEALAEGAHRATARLW